MEINPAVKYKLENKKYFEALNYVNGVTGLEKKGRDDIEPIFVDSNGKAIFFVKPKNSDNGSIVYENDFEFSRNEELNKKLVSGFESRLKN